MAKVPDVAFGAPLVLVDGNPWRRIVEAAKTLNVDLIVVGNHKHHGLDRVFESLAAKVIDHTDPGRAGRPRARPRPPPKPLKRSY